MNSRQNTTDNPWFSMIGTAKETWDSPAVEGVSTVFHLGEPAQPLCDRVVAFNVRDSMRTLGHRNLASFRFLLDHDKEWSYLARINASCYCSKRRLRDFCQDLPDTGAVVGGVVEAGTQHGRWMWGGLQYIFSRDVVQAITDNSDKWNHREMEDVAMSYMVFGLGYDVTGKLGSASIDKVGGKWRFMSYSADDSFDFDDVGEIKARSNCHFIRVKQDRDREIDKWLMMELKNKYDN